MQLKLHSMTDLITNSSTVIFTYSNRCPKACKEMIDEILKTFSIDKTCDDLFVLTILNVKYRYIERLEENTKKDDPRRKLLKNNCKGFNQLFDDIKSGKVEKPDWMQDVEAEECNGYNSSTTLYIYPKKPEYEKMAEMVSRFLYSTSHEATRDG